MTTVEQVRDGSAVGPVVRTVALAGLGALAVGAALRWAEAAREDDDAYLAGDLVAVTVFAAAGVLVVALLAASALRGGEGRVRRVAVGLAVAAVVTLPLLWWNAVPVVLAAAVLALGARVQAGTVPRAARLAAVLVVAVVVALWAGPTLAAVL